MPDKDWIQKRIHAIVKWYGADFFIGKKVLDVGSGNGTIARAFSDMGARVTCIDARKTQLDAIHNTNPSIRCIKADLDMEWPFHNDYFDIALHLGTLNHLTYVEKHLQFICQITNHIVIDTQVCDSTNPAKCILVKENRSNTNHSFNGVGCRPSPAFIERILSANGMEFDLLQDSSCNSGRFIYDWTGKNSNSISQGLSRMWFTTKVAPIDVLSTAPMKRAAMQQRRAKTVPEPVLPPFQLLETEPSNGLLGRYPTSTASSASSDSDQVRRDSQDFGLMFPETFSAKEKFKVSGTILPVSLSSRLWLKKVGPFFPNIAVHHIAHTMRNFKKSKDIPDIVMCPVDRLTESSKIWIEEWADYELTTSDVVTLSKCAKIMTPSLINAQEIMSKLPKANVQKLERPWPIIDVAPQNGSYFMYFEKNQEATRFLLKSWEPEFGNLVVVGTKQALPEFATYVSDCASYDTLMSYCLGAKAIIDISNNNYYMSGVCGVAKTVGIPLITNNTYQIDYGSHTLITQDKAASIVPIPTNIKRAISDFLSKQTVNRTKPAGNAHINSAVEKMME